MLQQLRAASKSWVATAIILMFIGVFALWGVNDIFHGSVDTTVAKVGNQEVTRNDYDLELRNAIKQQAAQTHSDFTMEQAKATGFDRQVLQIMIDRKAMDNEVAKLGLAASDEAVGTMIRNNKAFQGADGNFDRNTLNQMLAQRGLSEGQFLELTRADVARSQLITGGISEVPIDPGFVRLLYDYLNESRRIEYIVLTDADAGAVPEPTDADLAAYHKAHAAEFSTKELRALDYVSIGPQDVANEIQISDADLQKAYDANKAAYNKPETRAIEQIVFPSQAEAQTAAAQLKTGADFHALAKTRGLKDDDVKLGTFTKAQLDPKLADTAFTTAADGVSAPVQGPFGWVVLHVAAVTPGEDKSFDQVKDQIRTQTVKDRAAAKVSDLINAFEDARAGGASLTEAAMKIGATMHHVDAVDMTGNDAKGEKAAIPADKNFLQEVFTSETGVEGDLFDSTDRTTSYAIKVAGVTPPTVKPLDAVRDAVKAGWLKDKRVTVLVQRVKTLTDEAKTAKDLNGIAKETGKPVQTADNQTRRAESKAMSQELSHALFAQPPGAIMSGLGTDPGTFVIARATEVQHPLPDMSNPEYANYGQILETQLTDDIGRTMEAQLRISQGVTVNEATRASVVGGEAQ